MMGDPDPGRAPGGPAPLEHVRVPFKILEPHVMREARAALEVREAQIAGLLNRIALGQSKVRFSKGWNDPRPRGKGIPRDAATEKLWAEYLDKQTMQLLEDLARTEAGFKLLSDLDASTYTTTIIPWGGPVNRTDWPTKEFPHVSLQADGRPGRGASPTISMNPNLTSFVLPGEKEKPWMTERLRYGFYHELIHAWHGVNGTSAPGAQNGRDNAEWQAVGLGPWAGDAVSENAIRRQMGKELRPDVTRATL